jgi:hypothetical protein
MALTTIKSVEYFDDPEHWMGYKIIMNNSKYNITCKIENSHKCYEKWGAYTKSNLNDFIGAEYYSIDVTEETRDKYDEMRILTVKIATNRGDISIHLYNEHNGYYHHDVFIQSKTGIKNLTI